MQKPHRYALLLLLALLPLTPATAQQLLWDADGVPICTADGWQRYPRMATDDAHGAIIAWEDIRVGSDPAIYAARITSEGATPWTKDGVQLSAPQPGQRLAGILPDGSGGAFVAWWHRGGGDSDLFMQRVDSSGAVLWQQGGVAVSDASGRVYRTQGPGSHTMHPRSDPHENVEEQFVTDLGRRLEKAAGQGRFECLALVADARTLGRLRRGLGKNLAARVVEERPLDLTPLSLHDLEPRIRDILGWNA